MQNEEFEEEVFVDVNSLPLRPPQPMVPPEKAVRRPWHPVMWDDSLIGIQSQDHKDTDDEVERRPCWEAPYISFAEAEQIRIKNLRTQTDAEREMPQRQPRGEYPHKQRIRNLRRLIADGKVKPTPETLIFFLCNKFAVSDDRQKKVVV